MSKKGPPINNSPRIKEHIFEKIVSVVSTASIKPVYEQQTQRNEHNFKQHNLASNNHFQSFGGRLQPALKHFDYVLMIKRTKSLVLYC